MLLFLVLLSTVSLVSSAGNVCTSGEVNKPSNSKPYYWPSTWTENKTAPAIEGSQRCSWYVNIPDGYYAKLIVSGKTKDSTSEFQISDPVGRVVQTTQEGMQPYYFAPSSFVVYVNIVSPATFAFKVQWLPLPTKAGKITGVSSTPIIINSTNALFYQGYSAVTGVSLLPFPQNAKDYYSMRSSLIFDGDDLNKNYAASLFEIYQNELQWVSNAAHVYVVNLEASTNRDLLLIQEAGYVRDMNYVELHPVLNSKYTVNVDSTEKQSTLVSATYISQTLTDVTLDTTGAVIAIIKGTPTPNNRGMEYSQAQLKKLLPMSFPAGVYQFIVSSGKATFTFKA